MPFFNDPLYIIRSILVSDGEALLVVSGLLQFVDHSDSIVLDRDVAGASSRVDDQIVLAETELASALALLLKLTGRREEHPVEVVLLGKAVEIEVTQ